MKTALVRAEKAAAAFRERNSRERSVMYHTECVHGRMKRRRYEDSNDLNATSLSYLSHSHHIYVRETKAEDVGFRFKNTFWPNKSAEILPNFNFNFIF